MWYGVINRLTRESVGKSESLADPRTGESAASTRSLASFLLMWAHTVSFNEQQTYARVSSASTILHSSTETLRHPRTGRARDQCPESTCTQQD